MYIMHYLMQTDWTKKKMNHIRIERTQSVRDLVNKSEQYNIIINNTDPDQ